MESIKLSDLIGQKIVELSYCYTPETHEKYSIQTCITFIKLCNQWVIGIPDIDDNEYIHLTQENISYFLEGFNKGDKISNESAKLLIGERIADILFCYVGAELDYGRSAYFKLSNDHYLTENKYAPNGISVGPIILNEEWFCKEKQRLASLGIDIRSGLISKGKIP